MMRQLVLDLGLAQPPSLANFYPGANAAALEHLKSWLGQADSIEPRPALPIYLWGGPACGKTHLLLALRCALQDAGQSVGWLDASTHRAEAFDERWAVLLMDDVHAFNEQQQQAAFNWFVNAQTQQLAVLAAGAVPPLQLKLRDDLRSRLGWGHVFALQTLTEPQRRLVLQANALARGLDLSAEVTDFILSRFSRDLGSLIDLLDLIDSYAWQTRRAITIPLIKAVLDRA